MQQGPANIMLTLERAWLDRWIRGDPSGYLELCSEDVRYFDTYLGGWIDGIEALGAHLEQLRGRVLLEGYDIEHPRVLHMEDTALVTYIWVGYSGQQRAKWCASDSYRSMAGDWRIVQGLWSHIPPATTAT